MREEFVNIVTETDVAWFAGIYEGEGTVIRWSQKHKSRGISITQKDPWLITQVIGLFGGKMYTQGKVAYQWSLSGTKATRVAKLIYPYLSPRRREQLVSAGVV